MLDETCCAIQIESQRFVSRLQRSPAQQIGAVLSSRPAAYLLLAASVDLFALTPVFSRRIDTSVFSGGILVAWAFFGAVSLVLLMLLWFAMWWHWLVIDCHHSSARKIWFAILLCSFWWGSAIYYLLVYLPSNFPPYLAGDVDSTNSTSARTMTQIVCQGLRWRVYRFRGPKSKTA